MPVPDRSLPKMFPPPSYYRTRAALDLLRAFGLPILAVTQLQRLSGLQLGLLAVPVHVLGIVLCGVVRNAYYDYNQTREARRLGAKPVPRIKGKLPGNVDILLRMLNGFKTTYIQEVYLDLFKEYQCTTLNTRILWVDQVLTLSSPSRASLMGFSRRS